MNEKNTSTWKLKVSSENVSPKLKAEILNRPLLTTLKSSNQKDLNQFKSVEKKRSISPFSLPEEFDGRKVWKDFLVPPKNQASCGSCWAFASSSCLSDRFNIQSKGKLHIILSPAQMILCNFQGKEFDVKHPETSSQAVNILNVASIKDGACQGNSLFDAWRYLTIIGTCLDTCIPYGKTLGTTFEFNSISKYEKDNTLPLCYDVAGKLMDMCSDVEYNTYTGVEFGTPARFFRSLKFYSIHNDEKSIMEEIYKYGPVTTGMEVYSSFYLFDPKREVYSHNQAEINPIGGHAIEIVGWGSSPSFSSGKPYWIIKNSWGPDWGLNGYFYMERGTNNCKIEENVLVGIPDFFYPEDYDISLHLEDNVETDQIKTLRKQINTDISLAAGGINPRTGYTRRIEVTKPWIDLTPIIDYKTLPDWKSFVAAKVTKEDEGSYFYIFVFVFFFLVIIFLLLKNHNLI